MVAHRGEEEEEEKEEEKGKEVNDSIKFFSIDSSSFTFRSSVYLIVPNISRHIGYRFCFQVLIHEIQLVRTKTSLLSSSVFFSLL